MIADNVRIPVVASGGAGEPRHLAEVFMKGHADAAIAAGILHTGKFTIPQIKKELTEAGVPVRKQW